MAFWHFQLCYMLGSSSRSSFPLWKKSTMVGFLIGSPGWNACVCVIIFINWFPCALWGLGVMLDSVEYDWFYNFSYCHNWRKLIPSAAADFLSLFEHSSLCTCRPHGNEGYMCNLLPCLVIYSHLFLSFLSDICKCYSPRSGWSTG